MCMWWVAADNQKSQKDTGEPEGLQMVAFLKQSNKLSLSSEWGAPSQPEAVGPGWRPPVFIRVTYRMARIEPQNPRWDGPRAGLAFRRGTYLVAA